MIERRLCEKKKRDFVEVLVFETSVQVAQIWKRSKVVPNFLSGKAREGLAEQQVVWYPNSRQHPATR